MDGVSKLDKLVLDKLAARLQPFLAKIKVSNNSKDAVCHNFHNHVRDNPLR